MGGDSNNEDVVVCLAAQRLLSQQTLSLTSEPTDLPKTESGATSYFDQIDEEGLFTEESASRLSSKERALSGSELSSRSASREREVRSPSESKESGGAASKEEEAPQKQPPASQPSAEDIKKQREALEAQAKYERDIVAKFEQGAGEVVIVIERG